MPIPKLTCTLHQFMTTSKTTEDSIGELEASFPLYCRALRILAREGTSLKKIKRTVCWNRRMALPPDQQSHGQAYQGAAGEACGGEQRH